MRGKTVMITGGTSGIGEVAAVSLARMGARIVLVARDKVPWGRDLHSDSRERAWHRPFHTFCRSLALGRNETGGGSNR